MNLPTSKYAGHTPGLCVGDLEGDALVHGHGGGLVVYRVRNASGEGHVNAPDMALFADAPALLADRDKLAKQVEAARKVIEIARVLSGHHVTADRTAGQWSRLHSAIDAFDLALAMSGDVV